jgi:hypothetical protein
MWKFCVGLKTKKGNQNEFSRLSVSLTPAGALVSALVCNRENKPGARTALIVLSRTGLGTCLSDRPSVSDLV